MGLAEPKRRITIAKDPNNTKWANDTSRFGHRVLQKHGWTPGGTLGASNSSHAQHFTAASHSHVRVVIKENTRGLGAKIGSDKPENFGLAGLESILGRLNGREGEVKQEQDRLEGLRRRAAIGQKFGFMNFVSAGFLVGDRVVPKNEFKDEMVVKEEIKQEIKEEEGVTAPSEGEERRKKRKRVKIEEDEDVRLEDAEEQPKLKRKKKSMNLRAEMAEQETTKVKKEKKDRKDKKRSKKSSSSEADDTLTSTSPIPASAPVEPVSDKARRKAEKRARKEEKKLKKALKKAAKKAAKADANADESSSSEEEETDTPASSSTPATGASTPLTSAGLTFGAGGRHAVRQRYIRQKKMAGMDPQALKEIFMIKT